MAVKFFTNLTAIFNKLGKPLRLSKKILSTTWQYFFWKPPPLTGRKGLWMTLVLVVQAKVCGFLNALWLKQRLCNCFMFGSQTQIYSSFKTRLLSLTSSVITEFGLKSFVKSSLATIVSTVWLMYRFNGRAPYTIS